MPQMNILIKPASGSCNMRCKYCFYADEAQKRATASYGAMDMATAENLVRRAMECAEDSCVFGFQGGEPTLRGWTSSGISWPWWANMTPVGRR